MLERKPATLTASNFFGISNRIKYILSGAFRKNICSGCHSDNKCSSKSVDALTIDCTDDFSIWKASLSVSEYVPFLSYGMCAGCRIHLSALHLRLSVGNSASSWVWSQRVSPNREIVMEKLFFLKCCTVKKSEQAEWWRAIKQRNIWLP